MMMRDPIVEAIATEVEAAWPNDPEAVARAEYALNALDRSGRYVIVPACRYCHGDGSVGDSSVNPVGRCPLCHGSRAFLPGVTLTRPRDV